MYESNSRQDIRETYNLTLTSIRFMNPSDEWKWTRAQLKVNEPSMYRYLNEVLKLKDPHPANWRYVKKNDRCPTKGSALLRLQI